MFGFGFGGNYQGRSGTFLEENLLDEVACRSGDGSQGGLCEVPVLDHISNM